MLLLTRAENLGSVTYIIPGSTDILAVSKGTGSGVWLVTDQQSSAFLCRFPSMGFTMLNVTECEEQAHDLE